MSKHAPKQNPTNQTMSLSPTAPTHGARATLDMNNDDREPNTVSNLVPLGGEQDFEDTMLVPVGDAVAAAFADAEASRATHAATTQYLLSLLQLRRNLTPEEYALIGDGPFASVLQAALVAWANEGTDYSNRARAAEELAFAAAVK